MMSEIDIKVQKEWMLVCLIEKYYETDACGGCCHILLDDGNYGEGFAKSCLEFAIENKDYWGEVIARLLMEFNADEQERIVERSYEIYESIFG